MDQDLWHTILKRDRKYDGIYYLGIKSTGIYCRPSCRSRLPKRENVLVFRSAEQAQQAGFRACKRCKPDNPGPDGPDAELAAHVIGVITDRLRQSPTLKELAVDAGVSPFHLQRTFKRVTGTTPAVYALQAKLERGKRLLADSEASVAQIADSVGIRSASHFTAAFLKTFGQTPTAYRQTLQWKDTIELELPEHFDFNQMLVYLSRSPLECMYRVDGDRLIKALELEGDTLLAEISAIQYRNRLQLRLIGGANTVSNPLVREAAVRYVREWLDLDTDIRPFYTMAETDPVLRQLTHRYVGLRVAGIPDLFETLCWAVIGQQITLSFAYKLKRSFVESFGKPIGHQGNTYWLFPAAEKIADLDPEQLTARQFSRQKASYIIEIARQIADGRLTKQGLLQLPERDSAADRLLSIKGVGPWTAQYVLMRCLHDTSAFPIEDAGLHQAVRRLWNMDRKPTLQELRDRFAPWLPWRAYVTFYMWRSLQDD